MNKFLEQMQNTNLYLNSSVDLVWFAGKRFAFTGFNNGPTLSGSYGYDGNSVLFVLNNITYMAIEDPEDGYRSTLGKLKITSEKCTNMFPTHIVESEWNYDCDVVRFKDILSEKYVLEIGTDHSDDYYPCCVMYFTPQELAINYCEDKYKIWQRQHKLERILK